MAQVVPPFRNDRDKEKDRDKRVKNLISFTSDLENELNAALSSETGQLQELQRVVDANSSKISKELEISISSFPTPKVGKVRKERAEEIDECASRLWNTGTRARRLVGGGGFNNGCGNESATCLKNMILMVRVYAFLVMDFANESVTAKEKSKENVLRLMKVGVKAAKNCLDDKNFDYAKNVLEKVVAYSEVLMAAYDETGKSEEKPMCARLTAEYFVLRTVLAWRHNDMQLAEHMFNKSMTSRNLFNHETVEGLSDTLYEMGKELLEKQEFALAVKWLERAYDVLNSDELDKLSSDATELRCSIIETLITSHLRIKTEDSFQRAQDLVTLLESEIGDKLAVLLLRLELLSEKPNEIFDGAAYSAILQKMIRTMAMNATNMRLFMFHIRKLKDKAPSLAAKTVDEMTKLRAKEWVDAMSEWAEKVLITRLWIVVGGRDTEEGFASVEAFLDAMAESTAKSMSVEATMAAHTLLWKQIESNYALNQFEVTEKWCRLAMHQLFAQSGELNVSKISRKLLLCALGRGDTGCARDVFGSMSDTAKEEPLTRFLMYKIAIRSEEIGLAAECLEKVACSSKDPTLLYACVLDAQQVGNKAHVLNALQLVLDKCGYDLQGNVHLPSLLRTTIVLFIGVIEENAQEPILPEHIERLCQLFEGALNAMQKAPNNEIWSLHELEWFSRNSYNLSLQYLSIWPPQYTIRLLTSCITFIDQYPADIGSHAREDITLRKMFCNFTAATALVSTARAEDDIEKQLQYYLNLRKHAISFDSLLQEKLEPGKLEEDTAKDLTQKLAVLLAFDFEAGCRLKAWDSLSEVVLKAELCQNVKIYEIMADCLLCCGAPTLALVTNMKKIVNAAWELDSVDAHKLSKYIRCLFQVAIVNDEVVAEELLDQVCDLARGAAESYPIQELDYLATKSFNHAIDLYTADRDEDCRRWGAKAMNVAALCEVEDGGALSRVLGEKWAGLRFDD